ncbi:VOC family protein [Micromonospora siamensis]|uniref:hypothetical protein n=1 Tax=Micromonospora siamensis TaxID=299152 RepID=UPI000B5AD9B4|nr:hypothetical protein [Micromonospora siamensis]
MFGSRGKPGAWGAPGPQGVYVVTARAATVNEIWSRVRTNREVEVVTELHDAGYGSHQFDLRDAGGNLWSVGTYRGT